MQVRVSQSTNTGEHIEDSAHQCYLWVQDAFLHLGNGAYYRLASLELLFITVMEICLVTTQATCWIIIRTNGSWQMMPRSDTHIYIYLSAYVSMV